MIKKFFLLIKRFILSGLFLYAYNSVGVFSIVFIPINFINLLLVTVFGIPAIICLILFSFLL